MFGHVGTTNVPGTVTGAIYGLVDNTSNQAATDIQVLSYPDALTGFPTAPFDVTSLATNVSANSFTVTSGAITSANFFASSTDRSLYLFLGSSKNGLENDVTNTWTLNRNGFSGVSFTTGSAATPEPVSLMLFGSGFAGIVALRRRKRG
jgi:hypothetical protein